MPQHDPTPDKMRHLPNALASAQNSTPRETPMSPKDPHAAAWISAFAALITALTGVAVVLLDHV